jgi:hypothetical protein
MVILGISSESPQKGLLVSAGSEGAATKGRFSFQDREAILHWSARLVKRCVRVSWCESSVSLGARASGHSRLNAVIA